MKGFSLKNWINEYQSKYEKGHADPYNSLAYKYDDLDAITIEQANDLQRDFISLESSVVKGLDFSGSTEIEAIDMPCCLNAAKMLVEKIRDDDFLYDDYVDSYRTDYQNYKYRYKFDDAYKYFAPLSNIAKSGCDLVPLYLEIEKQFKEGKIPQYPDSRIKYVRQILEFVEMSINFANDDELISAIDGYGFYQAMKSALERGDNSKGLVTFIKNYIEWDIPDAFLHNEDWKKCTSEQVLTNMIEFCETIINEQINEFDIDFIKESLKNRQILKRVVIDNEIERLANIDKREAKKMMQEQELTIAGQKISERYFKQLMEFNHNLDQQIIKK